MTGVYTLPIVLTRGSTIPELAAHTLSFVLTELSSHLATVCAQMLLIEAHSCDKYIMFSHFFLVVVFIIVL